jgi:methylglutaconyl-CoA hydratase
MPEFEHLELEWPGKAVCRVWLSRPELKNALNPALITALRDCFTWLAGKPAAELRLVEIRGRGGFFCSGADLNYMKSIAAMGEEENLADAQVLASMLAALDACPAPLVGIVEGGAFGGALGLLACCDYVLASAVCTFAFSEVRLGIAPATIAPYVALRCGYPAAAQLMLSGERFDADTGQHFGLVDHVTPAEELEAAASALAGRLLVAGPEAARATKRLLRQLRGAVTPEQRLETAALIARLRGSAEGQEGLAAFLEKRRPAWNEQ